jgi:thiamine transporter
MTKNLNNPTRMLTESAIMIGLAVVLSLFAVFKLPNGGSVTIGSMLPILLISFKYDFKWGLLTAFAYSLLQMAMGFYPPPVQDFYSFALVILLDYVIAFSVLALAGPLYRRFTGSVNPRVGMTVSCLICFCLRFLCHFLSGIIIWDVYAPEGQSVWLYSLLYNGSYMLYEFLITAVIIWLVGIPLYRHFIEKQT